MAYTQEQADAFSSENYLSESSMKIEEVLDLPILSIPSRNITKKTAEHFGVRSEVSTKDGETVVAHYFPYTDSEGVIVDFKRRDLTIPKTEKGHFKAVGNNLKKEKVQLFGTNCANKGGNKIWITEGEYDAMSAWQCLKEGSERKGNPCVVSLGFGTATAVQHIGQKHNIRLLKKFKQIVTAFDNDSATPEEKARGIKKGKEATAAVYGLLPEIHVAQLEDNSDPCDMYLNGDPMTLFWALMKPIPFTPEGFIKFEDIRSKALEMPKMGRPWPWPSLTKATLGRRDGEGVYLGSGVKCGKSSFVDKIAEHVIKTEKNAAGKPQKIALFKFEEEPDVTLKKVAGKFYKKDFVNPEKCLFIDEDGNEVDVYGNPVTDSDNYFDQDLLQAAIDDVGPKIVLYNNYGRCEWKELKGAIRHAVLVEGIKDIVIDPVTRLVQGMEPSKANTELEIFADEISKMAKDLGFYYYCFCHLNKPTYGPPHERGGTILSSQFTGSRAMMRSTYYMFGIERNKDPELSEKEFNTSHLVMIDDRKFGRTAKITLFYDKETGDYIEPPEGFLDSDCPTLKEWKNWEEAPDYPEDDDKPF